MAPGPEIFKEQSVPFKMRIRGTVNGTEMVISGQGSGDARTGEMKGKWVCLKPDVCPMSYAALQPTLGYGYRVYGQYPDNVVQWFQQCMPVGYTQRRVTRFTRMSGNDQVDEEGTLKTFQTIRLEEATVDGKMSWVCTNDTVLEANFKEGSVLLQAEALTMSNPSSVEKSVPFENGLKNYVQRYYPVRGSSGDVIVANQITINRPLFLSQAIPHPPPHWIKVVVAQYKHHDEAKDHIWQTETNQYYEFEPCNEWSEVVMPEISETKGHNKTKIPGPNIFKERSVPLKMRIEGKVNGKKMVIVGQGAGDARIGELKGKWICYEPDVCPMSWDALHPTFGYGFKEFGHYPDHVVQFFHECMPEGYTQKRITRFTRRSGNDIIGEEGTMTTMHTIKLEEGLVDGKPGWYCDNKVTLDANFREGSVVMKNDALTMLQPSSVEKVIPFENGLKNYVQFFYPIKDSAGDVIIATQMTENRPISSTKSIPLPPVHWKQVECRQFKDPWEKKDHIVQDEINKYYEFKNEFGMPDIGKIEGLELED